MAGEGLVAAVKEAITWLLCGTLRFPSLFSCRGEILTMDLEVAKVHRSNQ